MFLLFTIYYLLFTLTNQFDIRVLVCNTHENIGTKIYTSTVKTGFECLDNSRSITFSNEFFAKISESRDKVEPYK